MTNGGEDRGIRRILIALDASPHSMAALRVAAQLASELGAELVGLYVEDINLLRLAELPVTRQVSSYSRAQRQYGRQQVEEELHAQAQSVRRELLRLADQSGLRATFRVVRGAIPNEVLQASQEADMLILGRSGWSRQRGLGSTARVVISQCTCQTLVLRQGARLELALGVLYEASPTSLKALQAAANLLRQRGGYLTVILWAEDIEKARFLQSEANRWLVERGLSARFRWLVGRSGDNLPALIRTENLGALVVPGTMESQPEINLPDLLDKLEVPVLVVR